MTKQEAVEMYRSAMVAYYHPTQGFGSSQKHIWGDERAYGRHARAHARAMSAPREAEAAIRAAGLDFWGVWQEVHGVDPCTVPALARQIEKEKGGGS